MQQQQTSCRGERAEQRGGEVSEAGRWTRWARQEGKEVQREREREREREMADGIAIRLLLAPGEGCGDDLKCRAIT